MEHKVLDNSIAPEKKNNSTGTGTCTSLIGKFLWLLLSPQSCEVQTDAGLDFALFDGFRGISGENSCHGFLLLFMFYLYFLLALHGNP
jgi:hypothetical protein